MVKSNSSLVVEKPEVIADKPINVVSLETYDQVISVLTEKLSAVQSSIEKKPSRSLMTLQSQLRIALKAMQTCQTIR